jgi:hypothetical protein
MEIIHFDDQGIKTVKLLKPLPDDSEQ